LNTVKYRTGLSDAFSFLFGTAVGWSIFLSLSDTVCGKKVSKLKLAASKDLVSIVDEYPNLDVSCNARYDSVMYDLTPEPTGKRGRPAKHGKRLSTEVDFTLSNEKIGNYFLGHAELFQML